MLRRVCPAGLIGIGIALLVPAGAGAAIADAECPGPPNANTGVTRMTQTFTALRTGGLVSGQMYLNKSAGAGFTMDIYRTVGGLPAGSPIGSTAIADAAVANDVETPIAGTFTTPVPVTAGGGYAISVNRLAGGFIARDRNGSLCPGNEVALTGPDWAIINPAYDYPFQTTVEPSNDVTGVSQRGRTLTVSVPNAGAVSIAGVPQAGGKSAGAAKKKRRARVLIAAAQGTAAGPGQVVLSLALTKQGRKAYKRKGKVSSRITITYLPTGGQAKSSGARVKIKPPKRKKKKG